MRYAEIHKLTDFGLFSAYFGYVSRTILITWICICANNVDNVTTSISREHRRQLLNNKQQQAQSSPIINEHRQERLPLEVSYAPIVVVRCSVIAMYVGDDIPENEHATSYTFCIRTNLYKPNS